MPPNPGFWDGRVTTGRHIELSPSGTIHLDGDLRIRAIDPRCQDILGVTGSRARGFPLADLPRLGTVADGPPPDFPWALASAIAAGHAPPTVISLADGRTLLLDRPAPFDGGPRLSCTDLSPVLRRETREASDRAQADLRFLSETMEDHAAYLASLAEAADQNARDVEAARRELEREIEERRELEERLRRLAATDSLTGVLNRAAFLAEAQTALEEAHSRAIPLAVLMLDIDHFKTVNDRHGHAGGDRALVHLTGLLRNDSRRGDILGRLGGEEFGLLVPGTPMDDARAVAERLVRRIADSPAVHDNRLIHLTISAGLAVARPAETRIEQPLSRADQALYRAKNTGRNKVVADDRAAAA